MNDDQQKLFKQYYKGKIRSAEATIDQYIYFLNQYKTLPTDTNEINISNLNRYLKNKPVPSWQIGFRSAFIRWIEFLYSRPECSVNYQEKEQKLKKQIYTPRRTEYKYRDKGLTENQILAVRKNVIESIDNDKYDVISDVLISSKPVSGFM